VLKILTTLLFFASAHGLAYSGSDMSGTSQTSGQTSLGRDVYSGGFNPAFLSAMKEYKPEYIGRIPLHYFGH